MEMHMIHIHAARGDLNYIRAFVEQDPGLVDIEADGRWTPLILAAAVGRLEVVRLLLHHGANVNHSLQCGRTALHMACRCGRSCSMVSLLLERGADASLCDQNGSAPLQLAAANGQIDTVSVLLKGVKGADVDAVDDAGRTALALAVKYRRSQGLVALLLAAGSDPLVGVCGMTPRDVALEEGHVEGLAVMREWEKLYVLWRARRMRDAATSATASPSTPPAKSTPAALEAPRIKKILDPQAAVPVVASSIPGAPAASSAALTSPSSATPRTPSATDAASPSSAALSLETAYPSPCAASASGGREPGKWGWEAEGLRACLHGRMHCTHDMPRVDILSPRAAVIHFANSSRHCNSSEKEVVGGKRRRGCGDDDGVHDGDTDRVSTAVVGHVVLALKEELLVVIMDSLTH